MKKMNIMMGAILILFFCLGVSWAFKPLPPSDKPDRAEPAVSVIKLHDGPFELDENTNTSFTLKLDKTPVIACLQLSIYHQGTDAKPLVAINDFPVGTLEPCFPSLRDRNFIFFLFDDNPEKANDYQTDYQGWLNAKCFIQGRFLKSGENIISILVGNDPINVKDISIEILHTVDSSDNVSDLRRAAMEKLMKEIETHGGRIRQ